MAATERTEQPLSGAALGIRLIGVAAAKSLLAKPRRTVTRAIASATWRGLGVAAVLSAAALRASEGRVPTALRFVSSLAVPFLIVEGVAIGLATRRRRKPEHHSRARMPGDEAILEVVYGNPTAEKAAHAPAAIEAARIPIVMGNPVADAAVLEDEAAVFGDIDGTAKTPRPTRPIANHLEAPMESPGTRLARLSAIANATPSQLAILAFLAFVSLGLAAYARVN